MSTEQRICVVIPAYREEKRIGEVVRRVRNHVEHVVVVDDGSDDATAGEAEKAGAVVLRHQANRGKGAACNTGFKYAQERGFDAVIVMDGDGQHDPDDIQNFIEAYARTGARVLIGNRMGDTAKMPLVRRLTNLFMSWLLSKEMKQRVPDTQCGFRLYGRDAIPFVLTESERFAADSENLLRIAAHGLRIGAVPIRVIYRNEKSKINPLKDTVRFFSMLHHYRRRRKRMLR